MLDFLKVNLARAKMLETEKSVTSHIDQTPVTGYFQEGCPMDQTAFR